MHKIIPPNNGLNSGFIYEPPQEKDYIRDIHPDILGAITPLTHPPIVFPSGHGWNDVKAGDMGEVQANNKFDTFSCTVFAILKALSMYLMKVWGVNIDLCEAFTAVMSHVIPGQGNTVRNPLESTRLDGWLKEIFRPFTPEMTESQFFSPFTAAAIATAKKILTEWDVHWEIIDGSSDVPHQKIIENLKYTPIIVTGYAWASYYGHEGVFYDYNYPANHCYLIGDYKENEPLIDLIGNDTYRFDWKLDKPDHTDLNDFLKPLAKEYRIWSAHRIWVTPKLQGSKITLYNKLINMFKGIWRDIHGGMWKVKMTPGGVLGKQKLPVEPTAYAMVDEIGVERNNVTDEELASIADYKFFN